MTLKIGYKASAEQFGPGELAAYAQLAEQVGLDSVTVSDHYQPWRLTGGHAPNALAWMAYVAARTERVVLGTSVLMYKKVKGAILYGIVLWTNSKFAGHGAEAKHTSALVIEAPTVG